MSMIWKIPVAILEVSDRIVVLVKANGLFYCIDDVCTHDDGRCPMVN